MHSTRQRRSGSARVRHAPPKTAKRVMKRQRHASADIVTHRKNMKELKEQMDSLDRPPSRQRSPFLFHLAESFRKRLAFQSDKGAVSAVKYAFEARKSKKDASARPPSRGRRASVKKDLVLTAQKGKKSSASSVGAKNDKSGGMMWGEKVGRAAAAASTVDAGVGHEATPTGAGPGVAAAKEKLANVSFAS